MSCCDDDMCGFNALIEEQREFDELPYPVTVFTARYGGTYEGGRCIAVNEQPSHPVLNSATGSDIECAIWYGKYEEHKPIGRGRTHEQAVLDLKAKLDAEPHKAWPEFMWGSEQSWW